jgi:Zn-dependent alcohol dehydrogenase
MIEIQAAVLHEAGEPLAVETLWLDEPQAGEVLVRVAAAGVCHTDVHLADGGLGDGRWPIVLGHEGAGVVEAVGPGVEHVAPGDHVAFCFVPACRMCRACAAGRFNLCETVLPHAWAGTLLDGTSRLRLSDGRPVQHFNFVSCFAERCVVPAASAVPVPPSLPLWQASLIGCAVVTGVGAVRNAAAVRIGDSVCVIGCGGIGLQIVAAARLAGAGRIVAVDRDPEKLALALARGATDAVDAAHDDPLAAVQTLVPGGVDHALEAVGRPDTIRLAWDVLRPGATAVVVGIAPGGAEVSLPALELLSEKGIRGCYYGSGNAAVEIAELARLVADGRLATADVVTHVTDLHGIEDGFRRLREGTGARTIAVLSPQLADVPEELAQPRQAGRPAPSTSSPSGLD